MARRFNGTEFVANYTDSEKADVLKAARIFSLFASFEVAVLSNSEIWKNIFEQLKKEVGAT